MTNTGEDEAAAVEDSDFNDPDETGLRRGTGSGLFSGIAKRLWG